MVLGMIRFGRALAILGFKLACGCAYAVCNPRSGNHSDLDRKLRCEAADAEWRAGDKPAAA